MVKLFNRIFFNNNTTPALNATNLNAMSKAIDDIDDRVIELGGAVLESIPELESALNQLSGNVNTATLESGFDNSVSHLYYYKLGRIAILQGSLTLSNALESGYSKLVTTLPAEFKPLGSASFKIPNSAGGAQQGALTVTGIGSVNIYNQASSASKFYTSFAVSYITAE